MTTRVRIIGESSGKMNPDDSRNVLPGEEIEVSDRAAELLIERGEAELVVEQQDPPPSELDETPAPPPAPDESVPVAPDEPPAPVEDGDQP